MRMRYSSWLTLQDWFADQSFMPAHCFAVWLMIQVASVTVPYLSRTSTWVKWAMPVLSFVGCALSIAMFCGWGSSSSSSSKSRSRSRSRSSSGGSSSSSSSSEPDLGFDPNLVLDSFIRSAHEAQGDRGASNPGWWLAFTVFQGLGFAAALTIYPATVLRHAAMASGALCGGLTTIGAVAPSEEVLWLHGPLLSASLGILGISVLRVFAPCPLLNIVGVYGATIVYAGRTLTDTAVMIEMAKTQSNRKFNPELHAIGLYLDAAIVFLNLVRLFAAAGEGGKHAAFAQAAGQ